MGETVTATGTSATLELLAYATDYTITLTTTSPEGAAFLQVLRFLEYYTYSPSSRQNFYYYIIIRTFFSDVSEN